jgi:acyl-CoA synthetase (AMP-forming)/AMP-acid ligase II
VQVVGDAMARPIADAIERGSADVSSLAVVANGGALLTPTAKQRKLPKAIAFRPVIERNPAGKADYRWAREQAISGDA